MQSAAGLSEDRDSQVRAAGVDGIVTPDAVVLDLETAGVASRALAGMIDLVVQAAILLFGSILIGLAVGSNVDSSSTTTAILVLFASVVMGYPLLLETLTRGRTVGKQAMGLRAVTVEGAPIRFRHAMLRMMGGLVDRYLPPLGITGALFVLGTARHQRVGDLLAGTVVIRDPLRTALPAAIWFPIPPGLDDFAATIDPTRMTDEQYTVVRSFLLRVHTFEPPVRYSLAADLATRLGAVVGVDGQARVHPESFLLCAMARYQRRNFPQYALRRAR
jgi:uncharacterized RDD family membrane protein YckC